MQRALAESHFSAFYYYSIFYKKVNINKYFLHISNHINYFILSYIFIFYIEQHFYIYNYTNSQSRIA